MTASDQQVAKVIGCSVSLDQLDTATSLGLTYLVQSGILTDLIITEGAILPSIRNLNLASIYGSYPDFTHVLFVDSDIIGFNAAMVQRMVALSVPVVSGVYTKRTAPFTPIVDQESVKPLLLELKKKQPQPIRVSTIGLGFCLVHRLVLDAVQENTINGPVWFTLDRPPRPTITEEFNDLLTNVPPNSSPEQILKLGFQLGLTSHRNSPIPGEDTAFCYQLALRDIPVYVDPAICLGHVAKTIVDINDFINNNQKGVKTRTHQLMPKSTPLVMSP